MAKKSKNSKGFGDSDHEIIDLHNDAEEISEELELPETDAAATPSDSPVAEADLSVPESTAKPGVKPTLQPISSPSSGAPSTPTPASSQASREFDPSQVSVAVPKTSPAPDTVPVLGLPARSHVEATLSPPPSRLAALLASPEYSLTRRFVAAYLICLYASLLFGAGR